MKKKLLLMALLTLLVGTFTSCERFIENNLPVLYVVNGADYAAKVYCDNWPIANVSSHNNSGKIILTDVSINLPVLVEVYFYKNGSYINKKIAWEDYYFKLGKSYKMTLTNSGGSLQPL